MYFGHFNNAYYDFSYDNVVHKDIVQDILTRTSLKISDADKDNLCLDYHIKDKERPEVVAYNFYKDPSLHWTILYINNIVNPYTEWPLDSVAFERFVRAKYPIVSYRNQEIDSLYLPHHWESNPHGIIVDAPVLSEDEQYYTAEELNDNTLYNGKYSSTFSKLVSKFGLNSDGQLQIIPVSNYDYETDLNENKRFIKVISPNYIGDFVQRFKEELIK